MTSRNKPGVAFWATVVVSLPVLYVLSFGPACWITSRMDFGASAVPRIFRPMEWASSRSERVANALGWYADIGAAVGWHLGNHQYAMPQDKWTVSIGYRWSWEHFDPPLTR